MSNVIFAALLRNWESVIFVKGFIVLIAPAQSLIIAVILFAGLATTKNINLKIQQYEMQK